MTLPKLLLASTEDEFDAILAEFIAQRETLGYEAVMEEKTELMIEAKRKLEIE